MKAWSVMDRENECGSYQYDEFPESHVTETTDEGCLCAACLAEARPTGAWLTLAFLSSP